MHVMRFVTRAGLTCAAAAMLAATSHASPGLVKTNCHHAWDLGGAWVGFWEGPAVFSGDTIRIEWAWTVVPLDPEGRSFAMNVQWLTVGAEFDTLWAAMDTHNSTVIGRSVKVSHNKSKFTLIWYGLSNAQPTEITAIAVMTGENQMIGPDELVTNSTLKIYATNTGVALVPPFLGPATEADADHDLLPDDGATPFIVINYTDAITKRVPRLAP